MNITPEQLAQEGYQLEAELPMMDMLPFIRKHIYGRFLPSMIYWGFVIAFLLWIVSIFFLSEAPASKAWIYICYGFAIAFLLIPLHEIIHGLAYKHVGAKNTAYDVDWKSLIFMATADRFVANRKEFRLVALAPFVLITLLLLIIFPFCNALWQFAILGSLFLHTSACAGDFGLLSFFHAHRDKEIVTYDDVPNKVAYFYARPFYNTSVIFRKQFQ